MIKRPKTVDLKKAAESAEEAERWAGQAVRHVEEGDANKADYALKRALEKGRYAYTLSQFEPAAEEFGARVATAITSVRMAAEKAAQEECAQKAQTQQPESEVDDGAPGAPEAAGVK